MLVLHEALLVPVIMYDREIMLWKEKERSVQMDNFRRLLGIIKIDRVPNALIRELYGVKNWVDERIDEGVLG